MGAVTRSIDVPRFFLAGHRARLGLAAGHGHYVFADSSGAVMIPDVQIEEVLPEARKVEAGDAAVRDPDRPRADSCDGPKAGPALRKKIIMSSASNGVPILAGPQRNFGEK